MKLDKSPVDAAVAQMVEHVIRNDGVVGSSPISGTTNTYRFAGFMSTQPR